MNPTRKLSRRDFLVTAAAVAAPMVVPATCLGGGRRAAPSERINVGGIGLGGRARGTLPDFIAEKDLQYRAVCDCFADRRKAGKEMVDRAYGNKDCKAYRFHEELLGRKDIDAVLIATGDRWHAVLSVLAAKAGKDVYCEKPFTLTIGEGRAMVEAMKKYKTVWQCGTQRRSNNSYRFVAEAVQHGKIGKLHTITTFMGDGFTSNGKAVPTTPPPPEVFDYDRWTGQAPLAPYSPICVEFWRQNWSMSGGLICDMGPHYFDVAQWAHGTELSGPRTFEGTAVWPPKDMFAQVPYDFHVVAQYDDGVKLILQEGDKGVRFEGDEGWIHISDAGVLRAKPQTILTDRKIDEQSWTFMRGHIRNFLDCIRSRQRTASYPELAQRNHTLCHCANICLRLGRKVEWDAKSERFIGDEEANRMLNRPMRVPWQI
jgi:predicted dehydrogenase